MECHTSSPPVRYIGYFHVVGSISFCGTCRTVFLRHQAVGFSCTMGWQDCCVQYGQITSLKHSTSGCNNVKESMLHIVIWTVFCGAGGYNLSQCRSSQAVSTLTHGIVLDQMTRISNLTEQHVFFCSLRICCD